MNENQAQVLADVQDYVTDLYRKKVDGHFVFHNLDHTQRVVAAAEEMAAHYDLNDEDRFVLLISAWFHDTGFTLGKAEEHEKESIRLASEYLQQRNIDQEIIQKVSSCIQATRMPQSPLSQVEKIMCDADLFHLGSDDFKRMTGHLKQEQEYYFQKEISKKEWRQRNIEFLEAHQYFTDYAQEKQEPKKQEWIKELRKKQGGKEVKHTEEMELSPYSFADEDNVTDEKDRKDAAKKQKDAERGIQTIFRTTSNNHINLSQIADNKANIMISINSIILSIMLSVLLGRLEYYPHLMYPTLILASVCVLAIIFAVLATRPKVSSGMFTEDDIRNKRTNLLFFGNFHKMDLERYNWAMHEMLRDREYIYGSMIKDIYFLGVVLAKKYKLLRISYTIFMYGIIIAVIAFSIAAYSANQA
ncbi:MAG TPA: Pycsar system effector family protein [Chitinophagaceae bacterium]